MFCKTITLCISITTLTHWYASRIPSIQSIKRAMQTYARQGGSSAIFINDDGLRTLPPSSRNERIAYYAEQNIGWVARPAHNDAPDGFKRAGRFKKASNMNYGQFALECELVSLALNSAAPQLCRCHANWNAIWKGLWTSKKSRNTDIVVPLQVFP